MSKKQRNQSYQEKQYMHHCQNCKNTLMVAIFLPHQDEMMNFVEDLTLFEPTNKSFGLVVLEYQVNFFLSFSLY